MTDNLYQQEAEFALAVTFGHTEGSLMLDWAVVEADGVESPQALADWMRRAASFAGVLPAT